ncbi:PREDICTED: prostaglandin E2 receptor EP2 subtype-like, partial [Tinamus guttatus]|uniref:prostaglandin E2 receptor EP2 subtype-like n=1 Tax=Tinamus guttatus TaxID=94827 RepID=UPI00052EE358
PASLFHARVLALVLTDLLGTCSVSPLVLASYHRNRTLTALAPADRLCLAFGFCMSFFGLATMLILFAMALERCLALGLPYFYERFLSPRAAFVALPALYTFSAAFCSLPLLGFGRYVEYCPGTWCFIQMHYLRPDRKDVTFSLLYATLLLLLIVAVLLCNLSVIANLVRMHRRGQQPRGPATLGKFSMAEEIDHLLLLSIMTITFVICSLPFTLPSSLCPVSEGPTNLQTRGLCSQGVGGTRVLMPHEEPQNWVKSIGSEGPRGQAGPLCAYPRHRSHKAEPSTKTQNVARSPLGCEVLQGHRVPPCPGITSFQDPSFACGSGSGNRPCPGMTRVPTEPTPKPSVDAGAAQQKPLLGVCSETRVSVPSSRALRKMSDTGPNIDHW